jgi:hypothetical protein
MSINTRSVIGWLAWTGGALGILNLGLLPVALGEALCGPWG